MMMMPDSGDETCGGVLNRLLAAYQTIRYAEVQRVAVIQPSIDESLDQIVTLLYVQVSQVKTQ